MLSVFSGFVFYPLSCFTLSILTSKAEQCSDVLKITGFFFLAIWRVLHR